MGRLDCRRCSGSRVSGSEFSAYQLIVVSAPRHLPVRAHRPVLLGIALFAAASRRRFALKKAASTTAVINR